MSEAELVEWRRRALVALHAMGIEGVRSLVMAVKPGVVREVCRALELARSRVERGLDPRPLGMSQAIELGRAIGFKAGTDVVGVGEAAVREEWDTAKAPPLGPPADLRVIVDRSRRREKVNVRKQAGWRHSDVKRPLVEPRPSQASPR